jgi:hypothetical protein
MPLLG